VFWLNNTKAYAPIAVSPNTKLPDISAALNNSKFCYGYGADSCYFPQNFANVSSSGSICILGNLCFEPRTVKQVLKIMDIDGDKVLVQKLAYLDG